VRSLLFIVALAGTQVTASCGVKEDASLSVYAESTSLTKGTNAFGSTLNGTVAVVFDLGKWTQGNITVESIQLGLYRDTTQVVATATLSPPMGTTFPLELAPGQKRTLTYTITKTSLTAEETNELCAGPVKVSGIVQQAGKGVIRIGADPVTVVGCP
jgi:hypothetical protein